MDEKFAELQAALGLDFNVMLSSKRDEILFRIHIHGIPPLHSFLVDPKDPEAVLYEVVAVLIDVKPIYLYELDPERTTLASLTTNQGSLFVQPMAQRG